MGSSMSSGVIVSEGNKQHHGKEAVRVAMEHKERNHHNLTVKVKWQWMAGGTHVHHFIVVRGGHSDNPARSYHWRSDDLHWSYGEDDGNLRSELSGCFTGDEVSRAIEAATIGRRYNLYNYCCNHWAEKVTEELGQKVICPTKY